MSVTPLLIFNEKRKRKLFKGDKSTYRDFVARSAVWWPKPGRLLRSLSCSTLKLMRSTSGKSKFYAKFRMRPEEVPVIQRPRPVAYGLQEPLKKWLGQCVEEEIFEEVPDGEAVTWC